MKKYFLLTIFNLFGVALVLAQDDCEINTVNPDFEEPVVVQSGWPTFLDASDVPGWNTTASDNQIEIWPNSTNGGGVMAYSGDQYIELNANVTSGVYQDFLTPLAGIVFDFSFAHCARDPGWSGDDVVGVYAGEPGGSLELIAQYSTSVGEGWQLKTGSYTVPAGQPVTRFLFSAISTASGNDTVGNFLDAIEFSANFGLVSDPEIYLQCNDNIATDIVSLGTGVWQIDPDNPSPTTIDDINSNTPVITGFEESGDYHYTWSNGFCEADLVIHYSNESINILDDHFEMQVCEENPTIDLEEFEPQISTDLGIGFSYYENFADVQAGNANFITDPSNYTVTENITIYVRVVKEGFCTEIIEIEIELVENQTPVFEDIEVNYCEGEEPDGLETISDNSVSGSWIPSAINTYQLGETVYTFTPDGDCGVPFELHVFVNPAQNPVFQNIDVNYCEGEEPDDLEAISDNSVSGSWIPSAINTYQLGETVYTFTPDGDCGIPFELHVFVNPAQNPVFENIDVNYCEGEEPDGLEAISDNSVSGSWIPSAINTYQLGETVYTFTPDGDCGVPFELHVFVNSSLNPVFQNIDVNYCEGEEPDDLEAISDNSVSGSWIPSAINTYQLGETVYTFTPDGDCGVPFELHVFVNQEIPHSLPDDAILSNCDGILDLTQVNLQISGDPDLDFTYFETEINAINDQYPIGDYTNYLAGENSGTLYVRLEQTGTCPAIVPFEYEKLLLPDSPFTDFPTLCSGEEIMLDAGDDYPEQNYLWEWSGGQQEGPEITITQPGSYTLTITSDNNCSRVIPVEIAQPEPPVITNVVIGTDYLIVEATGHGPFEYSLDGVLWQSVPRFDNLIPGEEYTVYVRENGCSPVAKNVVVIFVPNFISPNNDGYNDTWSLRGLELFQQCNVKIFDRYGKIFVDSEPQDGNVIWNGKYKGDSVPSGDYWYIIMAKDENFTDMKYVGHISVRNRD